MPLIEIIDSIRILIYFDDHSPPHFHVVYNEYEELIEIKTLKTLRGKLPVSTRKKILIWAQDNIDFLNVKWLEFNP